MSRQTILITGAAGRVGTLLRPMLRSSYNLRLIDLAPIVDAQDDEEVFRGDLADPHIAKLAVAGASGVVHLAAAVSPSIAFKETLGPNYQAVLNLLEACRMHEVKRFIFASSHHAVGLLSSDSTVADDSLPAPDGFYGLSKAFGEAACAMYAHRYGISTLAIRIGNADPEVVDGRRERLWTSGRDLVQLIEIGLKAEDLKYEVVYGVSHCPRPLLNNEMAERLGYSPMDYASENRAPEFRPLETLSANDGIDYVGGFFAVSDLPDPTVQK
ncbi:NAD-dependent epimerase/dehydratase family protein [Paraburkholderia sp. BR13439]|uniref:NAD-dependent epimerase/dehydratase family protein n=1 Tax=unclassified Paraburkholderia TaxID=2615204 RepID=UPI0034CDD10E